MNQLSNQPIGIFDSGIGGLTVANSLMHQLPNESIIYFGDTAHLPYGDKSGDTIRYFSKTISNFLLQQHCKLIVIACNTASSFAYNDIQQIAGDTVSVVNVIDPVVQYIVQKQFKNVGVIGTKGTIGASVYKNKIEAINPNIFVAQLATPLLAPMIESGFVTGQISNLVVDEYLKHSDLENIEALVLGCTHYPLIKTEIEQYYLQQNKKVEVIATNEIVAAYIKQTMIENGLLNYEQQGSRTFYVLDYTESFEKTAQLFYGNSISLKQLPLFK